MEKNEVTLLPTRYNYQIATLANYNSTRMQLSGDVHFLTGKTG